MSAAFKRDKDITLKLESQIADIKQYKDSLHLKMLLQHIKNLLGKNHLLITILHGILLYDMTSSDSLSAGLLSQGASVAIVTAQEEVIVKNTSVAKAAAVTAVGLTAGLIVNAEKLWFLMLHQGQPDYSSKHLKILLSTAPLMLVFL